LITPNGAENSEGYPMVKITFKICITV